MSCNKHAEQQDALEQAHYFHILAEFSDLIKFMGATQVLHDMQMHQEEATNLLRGYFQEEE